MASPFTPVFDVALSSQTDLSLLLLWATFGDVIKLLLEGMSVVTGTGLSDVAIQLGMLSESQTIPALSLGSSSGGGGGLIGVFNSGGLFLGALFMFFITVFGIWNTASDGQALGAKWNTKNTVLRTLAAFGMIIPGSYGYNAIQMFILTTAILSCGLASKAWEAFVQTTADREIENMIVAAANPQRTTDALVKQLYYMQMCKAGYEKGLKDLGQTTATMVLQPIYEAGTVGGDATGKPGQVIFKAGANTYDQNNQAGTKGACGSVDVQWAVRSSNPALLPSSVRSEANQKATREAFSPGSDLIKATGDKMRSNAGCIIKRVVDALADQPSGGAGDCSLEPAVEAAVSTKIASLKTEFQTIVTESVTLASNPDAATNITSGGTINGSYAGAANVSRLQKVANEIDGLIQQSYGLVMRDSLIAGDALKNKIGATMTKFGWLSSAVMYGQLGTMRQEIRNSTSLEKTFSVKDPLWTYPLLPESNEFYSQASTVLLRYQTVAEEFAGFSDTSTDAIAGTKRTNNGTTTITQTTKPGGDGVFACGLTNPFDGFGSDTLKQMAKQNMGANTMGGWIANLGAVASMTIAQQLAYGGADPFMQIKSAGDCIVTTGEIMLLSGPVVGAVLNTANESLVAKVAQQTPAGLAIRFAVELFIGLYAALKPLLYALMGAGFVMAYFIPMMPFMVMSLCAVGWLIAVLEAVVASVLWAVMHFTPGGDQFMGSQEKGYLLILSVFMRPILIVIGLCSGLILLSPVSWFIGNFFALAVSSTQANSAVTGIAGFVAFTYIYMTLEYQAIKLCLGLPQTLASEVMTWIGGFIKDFGETNAANTAANTASAGGAGGAGAAMRAGEQGKAAWRDNIQNQKDKNRNDASKKRADMVAQAREGIAEDRAASRHRDMMGAIRGGGGGGGGGATPHGAKNASHTHPPG